MEEAGDRMVITDDMCAYGAAELGRWPNPTQAHLICTFIHNELIISPHHNAATAPKDCAETLVDAPDRGKQRSDWRADKLSSMSVSCQAGQSI